MTKAEAIAIMGEPDDVEVTNAAEYIYWYQYDDIYLISAGIRNDMISEVYNDIVSSMEDNVQVSTEIGTEIQDLNEGVSKLDYGMTLQEVENILGNKYIAVKKDSLGYSKVKWYDKKENSVEINFDNKNTVWKIGKVSADK